jgi:hypothetical protein
MAYFIFLLLIPIWFIIQMGAAECYSTLLEKKRKLSKVKQELGSEKPFLYLKGIDFLCAAIAGAPFYIKVFLLGVAIWYPRFALKLLKSISVFPMPFWEILWFFFVVFLFAFLLRAFKKLPKEDLTAFIILILVDFIFISVFLFINGIFFAPFVKRLYLL